MLPVSISGLIYLLTAYDFDEIPKKFAIPILLLGTEQNSRTLRSLSASSISVAELYSVTVKLPLITSNFILSNYHFILYIKIT